MKELFLDYLLLFFLLLSSFLVWQTPNLLSVFFLLFLSFDWLLLPFTEQYNIDHIRKRLSFFLSVFFFFSIAMNLRLFYFEEKNKKNNHSRVCLLWVKTIQFLLCFFFFLPVKQPFTFSFSMVRSLQKEQWRYLWDTIYRHRSSQNKSPCHNRLSLRNCWETLRNQ